MKKILISLLLVAFLAVSAVATPTHDTFHASLYYDYDIFDAGGSGYDPDGDGEGNWYWYPLTEWYNQWFYNDPPSLNRMKEISWGITVTPLGGGGSILNGGGGGAVDNNIVIAINWSTMAWPGGTGEPPLPDPGWVEDDENNLIVRHEIFNETNMVSTQSISGSYSIEDYNPEWVSIDIFGRNVAIEGWIDHECLVPEPATIALLALGGLLLRKP